MSVYSIFEKIFDLCMLSPVIMLAIESNRQNANNKKQIQTSM